MGRTEKVAINHGLAFLALLGFMAGFFGARLFTTFYPHTVVVTGGVHFHHFWYGLGMVAVAGWLGIISLLPAHRRIYALVFGLGGGLIGDEIGLLLTFGNYYSELTYISIIGIAGGSAISLLFVSYKTRLKRDVILLGHGERLVHIGVVVAGLSTLAFAFDALLLGASALAVGVVAVFIGLWLHRRGRMLEKKPST